MKELAAYLITGIVGLAILWLWNVVVVPPLLALWPTTERIWIALAVILVIALGRLTFLACLKKLDID